MVSQVPGENRTHEILNRVEEGMRVCDRDDQEIGTVRQVYFGAVVDDTRGVGPATAPDPAMRDDSLVDNLVEAFTADALPETLRERLLREGFIRIDASGWFNSDLYAMPEQIASVDDDCVHLNRTKDELIER